MKFLSCKYATFLFVGILFIAPAEVSAVSIESVDLVALRTETFSDQRLINSNNVDSETRKRLESRTRRAFEAFKERTSKNIASEGVRRPTRRSILSSTTSRSRATARGTLQQVTGEKLRRRISATNTRSTMRVLRSRRENFEKLLGRNINRSQSKNLYRPRVELKYRVQSIAE